MEQEKKNFKPLTNTNRPSTTGKGQPNNAEIVGSALPIGKSLSELGLTSANYKGEADNKPLRRTKTNPKGSGRLKSNRTRLDYPLHTFIEVGNNVTIVLKPNSKLVISNFIDFIHCTENNEEASDIVDILPPLYNVHYNLISKAKTRVVIGDKVIVNFKYRSTIEEIANKQKEPQEVVDVKFVNLGDMTVVVVYLINKDFYPLNEVEYATD